MRYHHRQFFLLWVRFSFGFYSKYAYVQTTTRRGSGKGKNNSGGHCIVNFFLCKEDKISNVVQDQPSTDQSGSVYFPLDKANAPGNVATVMAGLSRQGFETIDKSLSLLSDSAAEATFDKIAIGTWTIKATAIGRDSVLPYSGHADVAVLAGVTTQLHITHKPVTAIEVA